MAPPAAIGAPIAIHVGSFVMNEPGMYPAPWKAQTDPIRRTMIPTTTKRRRTPAGAPDRE